MTSYNLTIVDEDEFNTQKFDSNEQLILKNLKIQQLKNDCCICLSRECEYTFTNCGHYCLCSECNDRYDSNICPKCTTISTRIKIFK